MKTGISHGTRHLDLKECSLQRDIDHGREQNKIKTSVSYIKTGMSIGIKYLDKKECSLYDDMDHGREQDV